MSDPGEAFGQAGEALLDAGRAWLDLIGRAAAAAGATAEATGEGSETKALVGVLAEAQLAFLSAGLGYGLQLADLYARRAPRIAEPLVGALGEGGLDAAQRSALVEETHGYLREAGEIAMAEARTFARTLSEIDQRLNAAAGGVDETAAPKRRWRAKD